jgi:hypothetical protein
MKTARAKKLQLAGIELVLPTLLCIEGRPGKGAGTRLTIGYANTYVDGIVAPLVAEWLSRHFHGHFSEQGRGTEGDLAAAAFYDKLARDFDRKTPFLAAIISSHGTATARLESDQAAPLPSKPDNDRNRHRNGNALSRFMTGAGLAQWTFAGPAHAFINVKAGAAQVAFEPLPGGIELTSTEKIDLPSAKRSAWTNEATAWYGFGIPKRDPAEIVLMLRNEIGASRHAHAGGAAHA